MRRGSPLVMILFVAGLVTARRRLGQGVRRRFGVPPRRITPESPPEDAVDVAIAGPNGRTLRGWLLGAGRQPGPAAVVVHGWGANAGDMLPAARLLASADFAALVIDARCHGRSDGDDFASMPRFAEDVAAATAWLRRSAFADPRRVVLLGHSVGAGACLFAASKDPQVAAVVSVSSLAHPGRFMQSGLTRQGVPAPLARLALRYVERVIGHRYAEFAPVHTIPKVRAPILLIHGSADRTVPLDDAHELHAAAGGRAELIVVPDAGHTDVERLGSASGEVARFLNAALRYAR